MSKQDIKVKTFPINNTHGTYNFRRMGEFEIYSSIGSGLFSHVFRAIPKRKQISKSSKTFNYIIKIFKKNILEEKNTSSEAPKKILFFEIGEVSILRQIKNIGNPNLIKMYDWSIDRKTCEVSVLMEHMPYDLRSYFSIEANYKTLDEKLLKKIAFQILNGLNALHKNRIIHFDIKPDNILFDPETNLVKITDFTLSQYITYDTDKKNISNGGTYQYMPVEGLMNSEKYSFKYDIWSVGCILIELCTRIIPFNGCDSSSVLGKIKDIYGLNTQTIKNFDDFCKNSMNLEIEKKNIINYIKSHQKIKFVNDEFYDFVYRMMCINPIYRLNAEEALKHPWLVNN